MWNILIVNCITNSCIWNACVTWQGWHDSVETCRSVIICKMIVRCWSQYKIIIIKKNIFFHLFSHRNGHSLNQLIMKSASLQGVMSVWLAAGTRELISRGRTYWSAKQHISVLGSVPELTSSTAVYFHFIERTRGVGGGKTCLLICSKFLCWEMKYLLPNWKVLFLFEKEKNWLFTYRTKYYFLSCVQ
jgi:hypothetical protein